MKTTVEQNYTKGLTQLVQACAEYGVGIKEITNLYNGYCVQFNLPDGTMKADAILHDGSYGNTNLDWETMGFPWDENDVSVHTAEKLASLITDYLFIFKNELDKSELYKEQNYDGGWDYENLGEDDYIDDDVNESNYDPYSGCDVFETDECF